MDLVGSSNNPVSGMAIATLLISSAILKATGTVGMKGMVAAISIGSVICIIAAIAGDTFTGFKDRLYRRCNTLHVSRLGELIGASCISYYSWWSTLCLLDAAWGYSVQTELTSTTGNTYEDGC